MPLDLETRNHVRALDLLLSDEPAQLVYVHRLDELLDAAELGRAQVDDRVQRLGIVERLLLAFERPANAARRRPAARLGIELHVGSLQRRDHRVVLVRLEREIRCALLVVGVAADIDERAGLDLAE